MHRWILVAWFSIALKGQGTVSVAVTNEQGEPVVSALIDHVGGGYWGAEVDATGSAQITPRSPIAVVRAPGYRSVMVALSQESLRVTLRPSSRRAAVCKKEPDFGSFSFLDMSGMRRVKGGTDVDYTSVFYVPQVSGSKDAPSIRHGRGPNWSRGLPSFLLIEKSVSLEEEMVPIQGILWFVDSRGVSRDGTHWRYIGMVTESMSYDGASPAQAAIFDRLLDTVCVGPNLLP